MSSGAHEIIHEIDIVVRSAKTGHVHLQGRDDPPALALVSVGDLARATKAHLLGGVGHELDRAPWLEVDARQDAKRFRYHRNSGRIVVGARRIVGARDADRIEMRADDDYLVRQFRAADGRNDGILHPSMRKEIDGKVGTSRSEALPLTMHQQSGVLTLLALIVAGADAL